MAGGPGQPASVLLLSGRPAFLDPLSQAFSTAGLSVLVARDRRAAQQAFAAGSLPGGVIIDLLTVDDDPEALCDALRDLPDAAGVPLLFIGTGAESVRSTTDALIAGGDGFFQLPIEASRVVAKIAAYVGVPVPTLPAGLLVTIDEHDLLERTPEPVRLVPAAKTPAQLLGEEDEDAVDAFLNPSTDEGATPPSGTPRPDDGWPSFEGPASVDGFGDGFGDGLSGDDDFGESTSPILRRSGAMPKTRSLADELAASAPQLQEQDDGLGQATMVTSLSAAEQAALRGEPVDAGLPGADHDGDDHEGADDVDEATGLHVLSDELRALGGPTAEGPPEGDSAIHDELGDEAEAAVAAAAAAEAAAEATATRAAMMRELEEERAAAAAAAEAQAAHAAQAADDARKQAMEAAAADALAAHATAAALKAEAEEEAETVAAAVRSAEAEMAALAARREELLTTVAALEARTAQQREEAQQALAAVQARRQAAEDDLLALEAEARRRREEEESRLAEIELARAEAEEELATVLKAREHQRSDEQQALDVLQAQKRDAEEALRAVVESADVERAAEQARLDEVRAERERLALELQTLREAQAEAVAGQEATLATLQEERARLTAERDALVAAAEEKAREEAAELEILGARRAALAEELEEAEAERRRRLDEEQAEIAALTAQKRALEEAAAAAEIERGRQTEEAMHAVSALQAQRVALEQELARWADEATGKAADEEARLRGLEAERQLAEQALEKAQKAQERRLQEEQQRLHDVEAARTAREAELKALVEAAASRQRSEEEALAALHAQRAEQEARLQALEQERVDAEARTQQRVRELEEERARAADEVEALRAAQEARRLEVEAALQALEEQRRAAEADVAAQTERLQSAVSAEEERLRALEAARAEREASLSSLEAKEREAIAAQEARLRALAEQADAERARLAAAAANAEKDMAVERQRAQAQLAALRDEQEQLISAAREEAERLAALRAEQEATRQALQEAQSRARLAFQSGRFDALPAGAVVGGHRMGADGRPEGDFDPASPYGGERADVTAVLDVEPAPPPPFMPLEPPAGRFVDGELPGLLLAAHHLKVTGAIQLVFDGAVLAVATEEPTASAEADFENTSLVRTLYLEDGEPVFLASPEAQDRPENALLKAGLITAAVHAQLRTSPVTSARRLCAQLVDEDHLKLEELFGAVRGVLTEQLLHLAGGGPGRFRYVEERAHSADRVRLEHGFDAVIAEAVRRRYDEPRLWALLGGPATLLAPVDRRRPLPPMSPEERLVLERIDGTRTLDDLVFADRVHAHVVLRAAALGVAVGAIAIVARGLPVEMADVATRRQRAVGIDRERIVDRAALARHGDYFTFLGVAAEATPFEVQRAAHRLRERFDPARYTDLAFADLQGALREIVDVANDAEAVLSDGALKDAYKKNLRAQASSSPSRRARAS